MNFGKRLLKSPKLYFYDSGLAAWLAGLRSAEELALSSLRGPLFETWAIAEALKVRNNHRLAPSLHYRRDRSGVEIDLLLDRGDTLVPVEFKAGQTVAGDWVHGLERYSAQGAMRGAGQPAIAPAHVVYGGDEPRTRSGVGISSWRRWPALALALLKATA